MGFGRRGNDKAGQDLAGRDEIDCSIAAYQAFDRRGPALIAIAISALLLGVVAHSASAGGWYDWPGMQKCQVIPAHGSKYKIYASRNTGLQDRLSCHKAMGLMRAWFKGPRSEVEYHASDDSFTLDRFPGWVCASGAGGGTCQKGHRSAGYQVGPGRTSSSATAASRGFHACTMKRSPPGTGGIFTLETQNERCRVARKVVTRYHRKWHGDDREHQRVGRFVCDGTYSAGGEGLSVRCATARSKVTWDAYLDRRLLRGGCGTVTAFYPDTEGGSGVQIVSHRHISCRAARHVTKQCIRQYNVRGWHARLDHQLRTVLTHGRKRIVAKGVAGGAPHCVS